MATICPLLISPALPTRALPSQKSHTHLSFKSTPYVSPTLGEDFLDTLTYTQKAGLTTPTLGFPVSSTNLF